MNLTQPQQYTNSGGGTPILQNWGPTTNTNNLIYNPISGIIPADFSVNFKIKDTNVVYDTILLKCEVTDVSGNMDWLDISGLPSTIDLTPITGQGITYPTDFTYQNLNLLNYGNYSKQIIFTIIGIDDLSGAEIVISTYTYTINLQSQSNSVSYTPSAISFQHFKGTTPMPAALITMYGSNWAIKNTIISPNGRYLDLSSMDSGITFGVDMENNVPVQYAQGSGIKTIIVTLNDAYYNGVTVAAQYLSGALAVFKDLDFINTIPFSITQFNTGTINATPDSLTFYGLKGITEPILQQVVLNVDAPSYTITSSPWLIVQDNASVLDIVPIATANMIAGTYNGTITITADIAGVITTKTISVIYTLTGFITNPYANGRKAFTLDQDYFTLTSANVNTYFEINSTIKIFEYFTQGGKLISIPQKLVLFQGKGEFNLGQEIHRLMSRFNQPISNLKQYKLAELSLEVIEKSMSNNAVINQVTLPTIKYVAGIGPDYIADILLLQKNPKPSSVKKTSSAILNVLVPNGNFFLYIYKNGTLESSIHLPVSNGFIISHELSFENFIQGDIIDVKLNGQNHLSELAYPQEKRFYMLPNGPQSNHILFEDEFLLPQKMNFTGEYSIKADIETISNKIYKNLVSRLEYISNTSDIKLTINTGWIIQTDIDTIDSILRSKRVWLQNDQELIELRPLTKSIIQKDTQRDVIEFTLEFQINKKSNEKTYSF
jgi:hypothetical protein